MTRNSTPRTRKQLREALWQTQGALEDANAARANALRDLTDLGATITNTVTIGRPYVKDQEFHEMDLTTIPKLGVTEEDYFAGRKAAAAQAEAETRRETLERVIDALELKDYGYREPKDYRFDIYTPAQHAERLWADLNTTLEHREAEKHAETVRKTAERVAGLTKKSDAFAFFFEPAVSEGDIKATGALADDLDIQVTPRQSGKSAAPKKKPAKKESK